MAESVYESYDESSRAELLNAEGITYLAQTFKPLVSHNITKIKIPIYREGTIPGDGLCYISILATSSGVPTGSDLLSKSFDGNTITTSWQSYPNGTTVVFDTQIQLNAGTTYALVLKVPTGDGSNRLKWEKGTGDGYVNGNSYSYNGSTWIVNTTYPGDLYFYEYGTPITSGSLQYKYEGFGANTKGAFGNTGVNPTVYKVTHTGDTGTGSLREACNHTEPRVIVFETSGTIILNSEIDITSPYITIAGQTAPSPGITIRKCTFRIYTHDVIIQHMRFRSGDDVGGPPGNLWDAINVGETGYETYNILFDHCSFSWGVDEVVDCWWKNYFTTFQWCIVSEGLDNSIHPEGAHSKGIILGPYAYSSSIHHCIMAHNNDRDPLVGAYGATEIVNNIAYNYQWGGIKYETYSPATYPNSSQRANIIGNYCKHGPETLADYGGVSLYDVTNVNSRFYVYNNLDTDFRPNTSYPEWAIVGGDADESLRSLTPLFTANVTADEVSDAYTLVLQKAGARPLDRDSVDTRIVNDVTNGTGYYIDHPSDVGGWPILAENTRTLTIPSDPYGDDDSDGDCNLQEWLQGFANELVGVGDDTIYGTSQILGQGIMGVMGTGTITIS